MSSSTSASMGGSTVGGNPSSTTATTSSMKTIKTSTNNKVTTAQANMFWQKQPKANAELFALTYGSLVTELLHDLEDPSKVTEELDRMGHSIGIRCIEEVLAKASSTDYNVSSTSGGNLSADGTSSNSSSSTSSSLSVISRSQSFPESAEIIKIAFRMFLGLIVETTNTTTTTLITDPTSSAAAGTTTTTAMVASPSQQQIQKPSYSIKFTDNPLAIFVELPEEYRNPTQSPSVIGNDNSSNSRSNNFEYSQLLAGMCRGMLEMLLFDCHCYIANSVLMGNEYNEIVIELKQILQDGAGEEYHEE